MDANARTCFVRTALSPVSRLCLLAGTLLLNPEVSRAQLLAYDGFNEGIPGANLLGQNGGFGFVGSWIAGGFNASLHDNYKLTSDSLMFGQLLTTGGAVRSGAVGSIAGVSRRLSTPLGQAGTTVYLSFLVRPEGALGNGAFNGFFGLYLDNPVEPDIFAGHPGAGAVDHYVVENRGGAGQSVSLAPLVTGEAALLVLRADFGSGQDRFTLYMNPTPGEAEPTTGVVKNDANVGTINALTIYSTGEFAIDEIRVGSTFADVTPVPEPTVWMVALLGGVTMIAGRQFRKFRRQPTHEWTV